MSTTPDPFRTAVQSADWGAIRDLLHPDVQFRSPAVHTPYEGRAACLHLLRHVVEVFEGFQYVEEIRDPSGTTGLVFRAIIDGKELEGWDYLTYDGEGRITELAVMVRPLNALMALAQAMGTRLESDPVPT